MLQKWNVISLVVLFVILLTGFFWPRDEITQAKLAVARWPLSTKKHLQMARAFFNNNYENKAIEEYKKAEGLYRIFSFLDINKKTRKSLEETKQLVYKPEKVRKDINYWETVLKAKPHYRDVFIRLAALNYQLGNEKKGKDYWQKAFYLDPNNEFVRKIGEMLGVANFSS